MPDTSDTLQDRGKLIAAYIDAGIALVPIPPDLKNPVKKGWNLPDQAIYTHEQAAKRLNGSRINIGLAHAYCRPSPTCALDIDDITLARPWLAARGIDVGAYLAAPDAVRIDSGREGRAKLLYRLPGPLATQQPPDSGLELRCAADTGNTMQDVLPPSIHPETGKPYRLIGDIASIPPIPAPLLAIWKAQAGAKPRGRKLDKVKADDPILRTLYELGMVRGDKGGGAYWIKCPFETEHSMDGGDGETVYYLPHTGGFANGHFKCLHAHCARRSDVEFSLAIQGCYLQQIGKRAPFTVATTPVEVSRGPDAELAWIIENAPPVMRAYMAWFQANAVRPHSAFALISALLFVQACIGRNVAMSRGMRGNLSLLLLAPTDSGKAAIIELAEDALGQLFKLKFIPAVPQFERAFGHHVAIWWRLEDVPQVIWANEELAKELATIVNAAQGSTAYEFGQTIMTAVDGARKPVVKPIRYSGRTTSGRREMHDLHNPFFSIVGTGVPRDVDRFSAAAAEDGQLNRFLCIVVEDIPDAGWIDEVAALPDAVFEWARRSNMRGVFSAMERASKGPIVLKLYPSYTDDWRKETNYGAKLAQALPGVWGRYSEKITKLALLYTAAGTGDDVTPEAFEWGKRLVRWANTDFARHFEAEGGGADGVTDAMGKAFMGAFNAKSLKGLDSLTLKQIGDFAGRAWRRNKSDTLRKQVIGALIQDGAIVEVPTDEAGKMNYRRLE